LVSLTVFKIIKENGFFRNYKFVIPASCGVHKRALKVSINVEAATGGTFKICYALDV
jgi:hypothetical protein